MAFLSAAAHRLQPWKNGLGISRVIADDPSGTGFDALRWQVSATEIGGDCPFSSLPGLDRLFVVIEGAGVVLESVDELGVKREAILPAGAEPHAFRGDWKTHCRLLGGPVRVLNVIARRGVFAAALRREHAPSIVATDGEVVVAVDPSTLDAWISGDGASMPPAARDPWVARLRAA